MKKLCYKCKLEKYIIYFHKNRNKHDGLSSECKSCKKTIGSIRYSNNHEYFLEHNRQYYKNNKELILKNMQMYYLQNKNVIIEKNKNYIKNNRDKTNKRRKNKLKTDINFKLRCQLNNRLNKLVKRKIRTTSHIKELGCTVAELKLYLESKFQPGMTWDNHGLHTWHIDHIIPFASVDLTNKNELIKVCHYTNLQPLWAKDNLSKGKKIT